MEYFGVIQKSKKQKSKELPQTCNACELLLFSSTKVSNTAVNTKPHKSTKRSSVFEALLVK